MSTPTRSPRPSPAQGELPLPGPPRRRRWLRGVLLVVLVVGVATAGVLVMRQVDSLGRPSGQGFDIPSLDVSPRSAVPRTPAAVADPAGLAEWVNTISARTDIPERALRAYAEAELATRTTMDCGVTWATLAGIGRVESRHGRLGGLRLGADGRPSRPIIGVPLDGSPGVRAVRDTDRGVLDGDATWDRAVGPLQFLPTTWTRWAARAGGDGAAPDPQDIDDAALSAARYLCASGRDLTTPRGWWRGVLAYNQSVQYGQDVFSAADAYAAVVS